MKLGKYLKNGKFYVWKEKFAIATSKKHLSDAFAVIRDKSEMTIIINQSKIRKNKNIINVDKDWKIITFDMVLPFGLVGFLAKISKSLAEEGISIFVISAFSTDHLLVKNKNLNKAINKLKSLGFKLASS